MVTKKKESQIVVDRHTITITHPDKVLFPRDNYTKTDLVDYYARISDSMFSYVKNRLIVMQRFPEGIDVEGFYHKDTPDYFPAWIKRISVKKEGNGYTDYSIASNKAVMTYLANQGCITPHVWLSKADKLDYPDKMIFDLDPGKASFDMVRKTALLFRDFLQDLGLHPFIMTTGSAGMHVVVPIKRLHTFDTVRSCARAIAGELTHQYSHMLTLELRKEKRGKKIFVDYLRNGFGAIGVAPYAVRPKDGAPVATPIDWDEVEDKKLTSQRYTIKTVFKRLDKKGDPWQDFAKHNKVLTKIIQILNI